MSSFSEKIKDRFFAVENLISLSPIIPSVEILDEFDAVPLADALQAGGAKALEVHLRTEASFDAISIIKSRCPTMVIGAGNIITPKLLERAIDAGAEFGTSPGNTDKLLNAVEKHEFPFMPGVGNGSEMMRALEYGHARQKFCPASYLGGTKALKYFHGLFPDVKFIVSGGINDDNLKEFLMLSNVDCAIGSWIVRAHDTYSKKWAKVTERTLFSYQNIKEVKSSKNNKHTESDDGEEAQVA